jgi:L,D-transpeptidase YnhG
MVLLDGSWRLGVRTGWVWPFNTAFIPPALLSKYAIASLLAGLLLGMLAQPAYAQKARKSLAEIAAEKAQTGFDSEARLIDIYRLIGQGKGREALAKAQALTEQQPHFQLGQLVYGDLLSAQIRPVRSIGDVPDTTARAAPAALAELREESALRLKALRERPAAGLVPTQFVRLSARNKHAIAIDTSRSRLYFFENTAQGTRLLGDYYITVGKQGVDKSTEGDNRTPLGVYFITNTLDPKGLVDLYGAGALPINYPNPYDLRRGKTGGGIWLHGAPAKQFSRAPRASEGCVVLSNPDLLKILNTVETRTTPVVIAPSLTWVNPQQTSPEATAFNEAWAQWINSKNTANLQKTLNFYTSDFNSYGKTLQDWSAVLQQDIQNAKGREIQYKDVSMLHWQEGTASAPLAATMVVTFSEVVSGQRTGVTKRQYWMRSPTATQNTWKIFFEGVIG